MSDAKKVPIDIQYQKLLGITYINDVWPMEYFRNSCLYHIGALIDRRIVPQKWLEQQRKIRDTIAILYPDLPPKTPELAKLINKKTKHEDIQYFDCKYIVESLLSTQEGQEKNFFGQVIYFCCCFLFKLLKIALSIVHSPINEKLECFSESV
jgi:hypothetical protein